MCTEYRQRDTVAARMGVSVSMIAKHMMAATAAPREVDD